MHGRRPPRRTPATDEGLSALLSLLLILAATGLVAAGLQAWLAYFTAPGGAAFQVSVCDPQADDVSVRLEDGGPIPYRSLEVALENVSGARREVSDLRVDEDGRWRTNMVYTLGVDEQDPTDNPRGVDWELASMGGMDNTSTYELTIEDRDRTQPRPLDALSFSCS
jgi:hypothetical protein